MKEESEQFCEVTWRLTCCIFSWTQSRSKDYLLVSLFSSWTLRWLIDGWAALKEMCKWVQTTGHSQASFPHWLDQDLLPYNDVFIILRSSPPFPPFPPLLLSIRRGSLAAMWHNNADSVIAPNWKTWSFDSDCKEKVTWAQNELRWTVSGCQ